ncbi:DegV family protein [Shimazuella sp. AN120528]|uniref:DegV family protein n=1 Tax=Shimazuella soli TaxID=1892854 RepID=UPI001F0D88F5|nr:DegV family protein [Shimazuella soli]MCH5584937.1 DegV family protein [Shimazuella soli]
MARVHVFTDSTADIPKELQEELNIRVIPLKVHLDNQSYLDGKTLTPEEFYRRLEVAEQLPTTSQPSPMDFCDAYKQAIADGAEEIISIHLSSALSGTYQSAVLAKGMLEEEANVKLTVVDSKSASYGIGVVVVAVARAALADKSLEECLEIANYYIENQQIYFLVDTLEYLKRGGRIGKAAAVVGSLLNIKPILSINKEGEIYPVEKVRGKNKAFGRILELAKEKIPEGALSATVIHADAPEEASRWMEKLMNQPEYDIRENVISSIGPVIGTHTGPATLAYILVPLKKE